jgi:hypothetical protein
MVRRGRQVREGLQSGRSRNRLLRITSDLAIVFMMG